VNEARSAPIGYTTARVNTLGKVDMLYGRVEARIDRHRDGAGCPGWALGP
jgi:hypothetical protein